MGRQRFNDGGRLVIRHMLELWLASRMGGRVIVASLVGSMVGADARCARPAYGDQEIGTPHILSASQIAEPDHNPS